MSRLLAVNVGLPQNIQWRGETVYTGIWKHPVQGRCAARRLNLEGDGQGDLAGHGGEHRAVFVYQTNPIATGKISLVEPISPTGNLARTSRSKACPTTRYASAIVTVSGARCSR